MSFHGLLKSFLYSVAEAGVARVSKVQRLTLLNPRLEILGENRKKAIEAIMFQIAL
jgi:hypothetical protein